MAKTVGLRTEILLTLTLLMGAALLFGGIMLLRLTEQSLLEQRLSQLEALSQTLALTLINQPEENFAAIADSSGLRVLQQLPAELNNVGWWLYDQQLQLLSSQTTGQVKPLPVSYLQQVKLSKESQRDIKFPTLLRLLGQADTTAHFALPLIKRNRFLGVLEMQFSLADIRYRLLYSQKMVFLYVLLYGAVLVLIGYYLLQRNVILPARNLLQATEQISRGKLDTRLPVAGPVEISRLAEAYNRMVEALRSSRQETQQQIDALEQTNRDLTQAREELLRSEKLASVGQLAAGLAHELGNPLSALIGYLSLLQGRIESAEGVDIVERSLAETERIDYLVRELLDFSRPGDASMEILDPVSELRKCVDLLQNQGSLASVSIQDELPDGLPVVNINSRKLHQVFINLLLNAAQACSAEGVIILSAKATAGSVSLEIKDNGCGIAADALPKIFDPFYSSKDPGQGTGLGLAVCHRIIEEAGGKIMVQSKLQQGSSFRVELPSFR